MLKKKGHATFGEREIVNILGNDPSLKLIMGHEKNINLEVVKGEAKCEIIKDKLSMLKIRN